MATSPIFAVGSWSKIQAAVAAGTLKYPAYIWVKDDSNAEMNNKYLFLDSDNETLRQVVGNNPKSVEKVTTLPSVSEAKEDVLYIYNGMVYLLVNDAETGGKKFTPIYEDVSAQISDIETRLGNIESSLATIIGTEETPGTIDVLTGKVDTLETKVEALEEGGTISGGVQWIDLDAEDTEGTT